MKTAAKWIAIAIGAGIALAAIARGLLEMAFDHEIRGGW
jgi:hypothetical protein